jgi:hypothetical protein
MINCIFKLSHITATCLEVLSRKIHPFTHILYILITTVHSYQSIAMATQAAQTTLPGCPSQVLQSDIIQESQVGSDRLSSAAFYEPDWQSYNVSGVKEQGCWFPTWPFIVYRYDLSCWFQPIIWTLRVPLPRYRTNWGHYTWQKLLLINPQTLFSFRFFIPCIL